LWFDFKLSVKLAIEAVGRALLKPRVLTILDIPAGNDGLRPRPMAISTRAKSRPQSGRAGEVPLTPLP
jgi:hypothetical protein